MDARRDFTKVGAEYTTTYGEEIGRQIDGLKWSTSRSVAMSPGLAINECIAQLELPRVTRWATNGYLEVPDGNETAAYEILGIECNYSNARVRVYVLDKGGELLPLCMDVFEPPRRDVIPGQVTVEMPEPDGRSFAVVKGRRWTRVHEYLTNGQLTARWFVDEASGEVRVADSARKPKRWPMAGGDYARSIVRLAGAESPAG